MNIKDKKIAIVGAGPGGLTLARLLQMEGADVKVYERDASKDARPKGATLDLHVESGLAALLAAGLMDAFRANYRPGADKLRIADKNANVVFDDEATNPRDITRPEIDRGPLQNILLGSLLPGTVIWGSQFAALVSRGDSWKLKFKIGHAAYADIVIGADGANSKIRSYITSIKPFYAGIMVVEGAVYDSATAIPKIHRLLNGGKIFAMGDEKTLIVSSKGDGSLVFYTSFKKDESWGRDCGIDFTRNALVLAWFKQEYAGWDDIWLELFENASPVFTVRPQYCMPLDQTWQALPNLTMLGDAAHLMLDALELSRCITVEDFTSVQQAISAYEKQMRARASATAKDTMEATAAFHSPDAIRFMVEIIS
jgi:2-polyprenyl-6-methoxyphenol hydroxylase-like FAD-dependent oxidoreductase